MRSGSVSNLMDSNDNIINPATEETLALILADVALATGVGVGVVNVITAGTPVQLPDNDCLWVILVSPNTSNDVYFGDSSVDAASGSEQGLLLPPKNATEKIPINNTNLLYVDSTGNDTDVTFLYGFA